MKESLTIKSQDAQTSAQPKSKSWQVIFASGNCMIGSATLFLAQYSKKQGLLQVSLLILFMGFITFKTCWQVIQHMRPDDTWSKIVNRLLGRKYKLIAEWSHALFYVFGIFGIFLLAVNILFNAITYIFQQCNYTNYGGRDEIKLTSISFTWLVILLTVLTYYICQIKNIQLIITLGSFGPIAAILFLVFIFYSFVKNAASGNIMHPKNHEKITWFQFNIMEFFESLAIFTMAMSIHSISIKFFQQNENQNNNRRDLRLAFCMPIGIFLYVAIFGYLGIFGKQCSNDNTIFDFYMTNMDLFTFIVLVIYFCQLMTVLSTLIFEARSILISVINDYKNETTVEEKEKAFNIGVPLICLFLGVSNTKPKTAMALCGALAGYFLIYHIPVFMHLTCLYGKNFLKFEDGKSEVKCPVKKQVELKEMNFTKMSQKAKQNEKKVNSDDDIIEDVNSSSHNSNNQVFGSPITMETQRNSVIFTPISKVPNQQIIIESNEDEELECQHIKHISDTPRKTRIILNLGIVVLGQLVLISQILGILLTFF